MRIKRGKVTIVTRSKTFFVKEGPKGVRPRKYKEWKCALLPGQYLFSKLRHILTVYEGNNYKIVTNM